MRQLRITAQITNKEEASLGRYLQDISKIPLINGEEEAELANKIRNGDQIALKNLVQSNLRFVVSVAKQYQNNGIQLSDLINEGNYGLIKAALKFDEKRGFKFISYAVWWIRQSIIQSLSEHARVVRLPLNKIGVINKMNYSITFLEQKHERPPTAEEIADILEISLQEIEDCQKLSSWNISLDDSIKEGEDANKHDLYTVSKLDSPEEALLKASLVIELRNLLNNLSYRENEILTLFYGLNNCSPKSLHEIGSEIGLTRERVRQIKEAAIVRLRRSQNSKTLLKYLGD
ncbi:sigma-70 family RNA polymerase sigma factor [Aegicerativicinus sediminis]|uniref:sigma-70 family RNA polymerase sigma factor n=1 Tax=Aegicerativicinus sediminis TaxID=2893202 RepID=UPI001E57BC2F|nr:RNA polymerase sigma factor RpoD/SigA [Aegicerativicinus sediminis]